MRIHGAPGDRRKSVGPRVRLGRPWLERPVRHPVSTKLTSTHACGSLVLQMSVEHWCRTGPDARGPTARIFGKPCCAGSGLTVKSPGFACASAAAAMVMAKRRLQKRFIDDLLRYHARAYVE